MFVELMIRQVALRVEPLAAFTAHVTLYVMRSCVMLIDLRLRRAILHEEVPIESSIRQTFNPQQNQAVLSVQAMRESLQLQERFRYALAQSHQ